MSLGSELAASAFLSEGHLLSSTPCCLPGAHISASKLYCATGSVLWPPDDSCLSGPGLWPIKFLRNFQGSVWSPFLKGLPARLVHAFVSGKSLRSMGKPWRIPGLRSPRLFCYFRYWGESHFPPLISCRFVFEALQGSGQIRSSEVTRKE